MRCLLTLMLLCFSSLSFAAEKVYVVEIANFYCPHCYKANVDHESFVKRLSKEGVSFDFAPIIPSAKYIWATRVYDSTPAHFKNQVRDALFDGAVANGLAFKTVRSVCAYLSGMVDGLNPRRCMYRAQLPDSLAPLSRALQLLKHVYPDPSSQIDLPVFIIEKGDEVVSVLSRDQFESSNEQLTEVVQDAKAL